MSDRQKIDYGQLAAGFEFPPTTHRLDASTIATYLEAVEEDSAVYRGTGLVPPMAIAASAMAAMSEAIMLPPGTIHVSQEVESSSTASSQDTMTSRARVIRRQDRGRFHILTIGFAVTNQKQETVLTAKTSFILPQTDGEAA